MPDENEATYSIRYTLPGVTLRQWYAGMAMSGLLASDDLYGQSRTVALRSFAQADAMIALEEEMANKGKDDA